MSETDPSPNDISARMERIGQMEIGEDARSRILESNSNRSTGQATSDTLCDDGLPDHGVKRNEFLLAVPNELCGICFEPLTIKRSLKLRPCGHEFHRTCIVNWFETHILYSGKEEGLYQCVTCRAPCEVLKDRSKMKRNLTTYAAWGPSGQPDEQLIISTLCRDEVIHLETFLKFSFNNTVEWIRGLSAQKRFATEDGRSEVYIKDIEEERSKMVKRMRTLDALIKDYERAKTDIRFGHTQPSEMVKFYATEDAAAVSIGARTAASTSDASAEALIPLCPSGQPLVPTYKRIVTLNPCGHSVHRSCIMTRIDEERKRFEETNTFPTCHCGQEIDSMKQFHGTERVGFWGLPKCNAELFKTDKVSFYQLSRINIRETLLLISEQKRAALISSKMKNEAYLKDIEEERLNLLSEYKKRLHKLQNAIEERIKNNENLRHDQIEKIIITEAKHCLTMKEEKEGKLSDEIRLILSKKPEISVLPPTLSWKNRNISTLKPEDEEELKALYE